MKLCSWSPVKPWPAACALRASCSTLNIRFSPLVLTQLHSRITTATLTRYGVRKISDSAPLPRDFTSAGVAFVLADAGRGPVPTGPHIGHVRQPNGQRERERGEQ